MRNVAFNVAFSVDVSTNNDKYTYTLGFNFKNTFLSLLPL